MTLTMDQEPLDEFEQQLAATRRTGAPSELRRIVLNDIERELRAARWDHRLARAAVLLLVVGVGMNASLALVGSRPNEPRGGRVASDRPEQSLVEAAIVVAEATDVATGRRFAQQMAALSGRELTAQEIAAIDAAANGRRG
jgi:hypothetical protein